MVGWLGHHRWHSAAAAVVLLFGLSALAGYWIAERLELKDGDTLARDVLQDMGRRQPAAAGPAVGPPENAPAPRYARIEDLPDLPRYSEAEPGQPRPSLEESPPPTRSERSARQLAAAATSSSATAPGAPAWRRNALPFDLDSRPLLAIVIDDVGLDRRRSRRAWELPGPLTLSFLPYARDLSAQAQAARDHGQELMLHLPMQPTGRQDPGPGALLVSLSETELRQRTRTALASFAGYVGVNNHMGSRFTAFRPGMETVLHELRAQGLMFLDSRTTGQSLGDRLAHEIGLPSIVRHVFLDDENTLPAVRRQLAETEALARRQGFAIAIGHPHDATLQALAEWLPTVRGKGLELAPATAVLRKRNGWD